MSEDQTRSATRDAKSGAAAPTPDPGPEPAETAKPKLSPAAKRALAEAEARRKAGDAEQQTRQREIGGRGGADPARYGDWEIKGRAIDF